MQNLFRTALPSKKASFNISYNSKIVTIGSCFSNTIGERLHNSKFNILVNPFGIIFNPLSIAENIERAINKTTISDADLIFRDHLWHSFQHHGSFSNLDKSILIEKVDTQYKIAHQWFKNTDVVYITLGTAWAYTHKVNNITVANCHKVPQEEFSKYLIDVDTIVSRFQNTINLMRTVNPTIKIVFTVSPVKHLRDGITENSLSKATLLVAVHKLCDKLADVYYFPAFELINDDLRDYRFYSEDMAHPNKQAEEYIFNYFCEYYFDAEMMTIYKEVQSFLNTYNHRPIHDTPDQLKLRQMLYEKALKIQNQYGLDLTLETAKMKFDLEKMP